MKHCNSVSSTGISIMNNNTQWFSRSHSLLVVVLLLSLLVEPTSALIGKLFKGNQASASSKTPVTIEDTPATTMIPPLILDNRGLDYIFDKNKAWKESKLESDCDFFEKLADSGTPEYMYIGCVDSTVAENLIMGEEASNIFVHRNVGGLVLEDDMNVISAIQFAVGYLKVKDIIVCGNYNSGTIAAATELYQTAPPALDNWLRSIRDVYRNHKKELDDIPDAADRQCRLVELTVIEQCKNIFKIDTVQKRRQETALDGEMTPRVHAMVYNPSTGNLKRIPFDFSSFSE